MRFVFNATLGLTLLAALCIWGQVLPGSRVCLYRLSLGYGWVRDAMFAFAEDLEVDLLGAPGVPGETVL